MVYDNCVLGDIAAVLEPASAKPRRRPMTPIDFLSGLVFNLATRCYRPP